MAKGEAIVARSLWRDSGRTGLETGFLAVHLPEKQRQELSGLRHNGWVSLGRPVTVRRCQIGRAGYFSSNPLGCGCYPAPPRHSTAILLRSQASHSNQLCDLGQATSPLGAPVPLPSKRDNSSIMGLRPLRRAVSLELASTYDSLTG